MGKHINNAIILTSIRGERGAQGFQGPQGIACYTGVGDPNGQTFTYPNYSTETQYRGIETVYYQDTVTGDIWSAPLKAVPDKVIGQEGTFRWTLQPELNVKGDTGNPGPTALDKYDINFMNGSTPLTLVTDLQGIPDGNPFEVDTKEIAKIYFQGTDITPDILKFKAIASINRSRGIAVIQLQDEFTGTIYAVINVNSLNLEINTVNIAGLPAYPTILKVTATVIDIDLNDLEPVETKIAYLSLQ
jgi:hypothetical protein